MDAAIDILTCNRTTAIPALIILYVTLLITNLVVGLSVVKKSRDKIMLIWFVSAVIGAIFLIALCLMPNLTQSIVNFFGGK